ncbi:MULTISPECIES: dATP/dGTP diphosphohydrolase domain-containing protein [Nocardia]|uniref:dATP/dGTP diphosphohydrolase domain-containing protein n=1 Tax=Nocardia TaxID=1817 RepID=UPI0007A3BF42|nr:MULTISPECIES: dATP/dGTP diphosphohydrolase domain-containing protein [Nocardia]
MSQCLSESNFTWNGHTLRCEQDIDEHDPGNHSSIWSHGDFRWPILRDGMRIDMTKPSPELDAVRHIATTGGWGGTGMDDDEFHVYSLEQELAHQKAVQEAQAKGRPLPQREKPVSEVRTTSSTGGQKGVKPARFDLIPPQALFAVAEHYGKGALKYDDHQWLKGYEWSKSFSAMMRHAWAFWSGEDFDPETGTPHMAAVNFHANALLVFMDRFPEFDDRPHTKEAK